MTRAASAPDTAHLLHEQFEDLAQQHQAATLGMWCFLVTEVLFFGVLLTGYTVYRVLNPVAWEEASHQTHLLLGSINTAILLTSSLVMALAVSAAQSEDRRRTVTLLLTTAVLGCCFLGVKGCEYSAEIAEHRYPPLGFKAEVEVKGSGLSAEAQAHGQELFYRFYWVMTGVHAAHMIVGISLMMVLAILVLKSGTTGKWAISIHNVGLYWHFVDVVWVFLFPLLYLVGHS